MKKHFKFSNQKQKYLLLALLVAALAGSAYFLKYESSYGPDPLKSSANSESLHWAHGKLPFTLELVNHASRSWGKTLSSVTETWGKTKVVEYKVTNDTGPFQCYPIVIPPPYKGMHTCSMNDDNEWLGVFGIFGQQGDPFIHSALVGLNDYYLFGKGSEYATAPWRNKTLCWGLGWTLGLPIHWDQEVDEKSCLNIYVNSKDVLNKQFPSNTDHDNLRALYDHTHRGTVTSSPGLPGTATRSLSVGQLGEKTGTYQNGQAETYHLDLGNGYSLDTLVIKKPVTVK